LGSGKERPEESDVREARNPCIIGSTANGQDTTSIKEGGPMLTLPSSLLTALSVTAVLTGAAARVTAEVPPIPKVTHVPTTASSLPYGSNDANVANLSAFGYVQEEYFISSAIAGTPYTTRILVRRPAQPGRFSGIIIAESIRSTATRSMWGLNAYLMRSGHT
jgi:hypothetical protein